MRRDCREALLLFNGMHRFIPALIRNMGWRVTELPVNHRPRVSGVSKYGFGNRALRATMDMFGVRWLNSRRTRYSIREVNFSPVDAFLLLTKTPLLRHAEKISPRMNLREQLRHLLPEILPDDPADSIKGTELIRLVRIGWAMATAMPRCATTSPSSATTPPRPSRRSIRGRATTSGRKKPPASTASVRQGFFDDVGEAISAGRASCAWSPSTNAFASSARAIPSS
jgi:hypothetical protein